MSAYKIEKAKRPLGLTIITILWLLGGISNLFVSSINISNAIKILPFLSDPRMPEWLTIGVPVELFINIFIFILSLSQMYTIYGLWTGKSWSYKISLNIPIMFALNWILLTGLYMSAPIEFGLREYIYWDILYLFSSIVWIVIYWAYLRQSHVRRYLGIEKEPLPQTPAYGTKCSNCNTVLTWMPEYNKWHCTTCLKWYDVGPAQHPPPASNPLCPKCKKLLGWMPEQGKWYCPVCDIWYTTTDVIEVPSVFHVDISQEGPSPRVLKKWKEGIPLCPGCDKPLAWVEQRNKWFCSVCYAWYNNEQSLPPPPPSVTE